MIPTFFLGGILMPSRFRFGPLVAALGSPPELEVKELDVYASDRVPDDYSLASEIDALDRLAAERGYDRFHLYGYSIGGSIALAYVAAYPDKVVSLAVDEPATDFSDADRELLTAQGVNGLAEMPPEQRMHVYVRSLVRPVVEVGPSPAIPATPEMALRPAGLAAVSREVERYHVDEERLRAFDRPVYMSYGGLSSERWETMGARLAVLFPDCTVERYEGCHHLNTSHQAEPERVAGALKQLWSRRRAERLHPAPVAPPAAPAAARPSVLRDRPAETVSRAARDLRTRLLTWRDGTHGCALLGCLAVLYGQIQASADQVPGELRGNQPWRST